MPIVMLKTGIYEKSLKHVLCINAFTKKDYSSRSFCNIVSQKVPKSLGR